VQKYFPKASEHKINLVFPPPIEEDEANLENSFEENKDNNIQLEPEIDLELPEGDREPTEVNSN